jgi:hypothetical protein
MAGGCTVADLVLPVAKASGFNLNARLSNVQRVTSKLKADGILQLRDVRALVSCTLGDAIGSCWSYAK